MVEDWLESVYGKAVAPAKALSEIHAGLPEFYGVDKPLEKYSMG